MPCEGREQEGKGREGEGLGGSRERMVGHFSCHCLSDVCVCVSEDASMFRCRLVSVMVRSD